MRAGLLPVILFLLCASRTLLLSQSFGTNTVAATTNIGTLHYAPAAAALPETTALSLSLGEPSNTNSVEYVISKTKFRLEGPAVSPLKSKTTAEFSHRIIHLFSPFAKEKPAWQTAPTGPLNTRSWSTIVGWNPGRSAFPDGAWHEPPRIDLISISAERQP
jgi:hypothetical protein